MKQGSLVKFHLGSFKGLVARVTQYDDAPLGDPKIRVKFSQYDYEAEMPRSDLVAYASEIKTEK